MDKGIQAAEGRARYWDRIQYISGKQSRKNLRKNAFECKVWKVLNNIQNYATTNENVQGNYKESIKKVPAGLGKMRTFQ